MFCVYGVSIKECRKQAAKKVHSLLIGGKVEQSDYEAEVKKLTDELFSTARPKSISGSFPALKELVSFYCWLKKILALKI